MLEFYHGTTYEAFSKIQFYGFGSNRKNWNCSATSAIYFYKKSEDAIRMALESAQIACASQNSQFRCGIILKIKVPDECIKIYKDYSCEGMEEIAVEINTDELNEAIRKGLVKVFYYKAKEIYNPYFRFLYLANLNKDYLEISYFDQIETEALEIYQNYIGKADYFYEVINEPITEKCEKCYFEEMKMQLEEAA